MALYSLETLQPGSLEREFTEIKPPINVANQSATEICDESITTSYA